MVMKNETLPPFQNAHMESDPIHEVKGKNAIKKAVPRVDIHVHSVRKRLTDPDGICAKHCIDAIVASGLLRDDSAKYVRYISFSQSKLAG